MRNWEKRRGRRIKRLRDRGEWIFNLSKIPLS